LSVELKVVALGPMAIDLLPAALAPAVDGGFPPPMAIEDSPIATASRPIAIALIGPAKGALLKRIEVVDALVPIAMESSPAELAPVPAAKDFVPFAPLPWPIAILLPFASAWLPRATAPSAADELNPIAIERIPLAFAALPPAKLPFPTAFVLGPKAELNWPSAVLLAPTATALKPSACVGPAPMAMALFPRAIVREDCAPALSRSLPPIAI
jgi:hypothetical protein